MRGFADDDVVVDRDAEGARDLDDLARHLHIGRGRGGVARRVVVDQPMKLQNIIDFKTLMRIKGAVVPVSGVCN